MKAMTWQRAFAALERMTTDELRRKYAEVFGEETNGRNTAWLVKRIAWWLQVQAEGGLSQRGRQRAEELADGPTCGSSRAGRRSAGARPPASGSGRGAKSPTPHPRRRSDTTSVSCPSP